MSDLLLELFSEEIPARMQRDASAHLEAALCAGLAKAGVKADKRISFSTPRRLALWIKHLPAVQPDVMTELKGPRADAPEAALQGFLKKNNLAREQLETRAGVYFATIHQQGRATAEVLKEIIEKTLAEFPWSKSMRWGNGQTAWVRPLHSILCIFDGTIVPVAFAGIKAGNTTSGHRFLAPDSIAITRAADYETSLENAYVIADAGKRQAKIRAEMDALAASKNLAVRDDAPLLDEVTGLVEWPVALLGSIDEQFMDLPPEVLTTVMRTHQKYFALQHPDGTLARQFIIVSNMKTQDGGKAIVAGNERVLRARFSDARFFWDQDRKTPLAEWAKRLDAVTFHAKLGSIGEKVARVSALAATLADFVPGADKKQVAQAAALAKADLVTGMVGEFAELQGVMGRYYALAAGEDAAVADAIRDHYKPLGPSDAVPDAPVSVCIALADKLDTLISLFTIGEKPTGSKDPFALRRAALGVIRIVLDQRLRLALKSIIGSELLAFFTERMKVQLKDKGVRHDLIAAVAALGEDDLTRMVDRTTALQSFLATPDGANLLAAYKRAANILAIEEKKDGKPYTGAPALNLIIQPEEKALYDALETTLTAATPALEKESFVEAMEVFSRLRAPVDLFFDKVMVNDKDAPTRENRLKLLSRFRAVLDTIANFSLIEG